MTQCHTGQCHVFPLESCSLLKFSFNKHPSTLGSKAPSMKLILHFKLFGSQVNILYDSSISIFFPEFWQSCLISNELCICYICYRFILESPQSQLFLSSRKVYLLHFFTTAYKFEAFSFLLLKNIKVGHSCKLVIQKNLTFVALSYQLIREVIEQRTLLRETCS